MKKGFTLIELLAVIVILAIIALIAVPQVLSIIENSRKSANEISARNYVKGLETKIAVGKINEDLNLNVCIYEKGITTCDGEKVKVEFEGKIEYAIVMFKGNKVDYYTVYFSNGDKVESLEGKQDFLYTYIYDAPVTYLKSDDCEEKVLLMDDDMDAETAAYACNNPIDEVIYTMTDGMISSSNEPYYSAVLSQLTSWGVLTINSTGNIIGVNIVGMKNPTSTVSIPATIDNLPVLKISALAFDDLNIVSNIIVPYTVEQIDPSVFSSNPIQAVVIGDPVNGSHITNIGDSAFYPGKDENKIDYSDNVNATIYADSNNVTLGIYPFGASPTISWIPVGQ